MQAKSRWSTINGSNERPRSSKTFSKQESKEKVGLLPRYIYHAIEHAGQLTGHRGIPETKRLRVSLVFLHAPKAEDGAQ